MAEDMLLTSDDGAKVRVRRLTPADEPALRHAISQLSNRSRYMRFFNGAATLPDHVVHRLADADGVKHVAWVAVDESQADRPIVGAVHAMRDDETQTVGEFSIGLLDAWHARGIARILVALLAADSRNAGFEALDADVLWENKKGRALMTAIGAASTGSDGSTIQYRMALDTVLTSLSNTRSKALLGVLDAIETGEAFADVA